MTDTAELIDTSDREDREELDREAFLRSLDTVPVSEDLDNPVNTDVVLDHYLEHLARREAEIEQNRAVAERRIDMIRLWERDANASNERECAWLRHVIETIARGYDFGKKKSRALPSGTFGYRARPATLEILDMPAAVAFAEANKLEIKKSVNKTPLLDYFKAHKGIIPDGCEYVAGADVFFVKTGG